MRLYKLIWNNEVIEDCIEDKEYALELRKEYQMAFKSHVRIKQYFGEKSC